MWSKIPGYPYWPAKVLRSIDGKQLDVRFFGQHDRSLVPIEKCFCLSRTMPANIKSNNRLTGWDFGIKELEVHIRKLESKYGIFKYAPEKTRVDLKRPFHHFDKFKGKCHDFYLKIIMLQATFT